MLVRRPLTLAPHRQAARALVLVLVAASLFGLPACGDDGDGGDPTGDGVGSDLGGGTPGGDTAGTPGGDTAGTPDGGADAAPGPGFEPECESAADCSGDRPICSCQGQCVEELGNPCAEPLNCGSGTWCNPCTGQCEPTAAFCETCEGEGSCGLQASCVLFDTGASYCGKDCVADAGCNVFGPGYWCVEVPGAAFKQCVPKSGKCEALDICEDDGDCPDGEICNAAIGDCGPGCTQDGECAGELVCVAARCVDPCGSDADCVAPAVCTDGRCKVPGSCESSVECPEPQTYCDKAAGECVPGCLIDEDCGDAALVCEGSSCVPKGCEHNYQCSFNEECEQATGECVPTPDPHCATCDAQAEGQCGGDPNLCLSLEDADGNAQGDFCFLECANDPIDQCPQGYGCQKIEAPDAGIDGWYCVRSCWVDPLTTGQ